MSQKIYSDEEMQSKVSKLSVDMQTAFIRASEQLYNQESNIFLSIIQESRDELTGVSNDSDKSNSQKDLFIRRKANAMGLTKVSYQSETQKEKEAVEKYLKAVGRQRRGSDNFYARPVSAASPRPHHAYRIKLAGMESSETDLPVRSKTSNSFGGRSETPIMNMDDHVIHKEKEILMEALTNQDQIASSERQRQSEILEQRKKEKAKKKKQIKDVATDLIAQSEDLDNAIIKNKEKQDQMLKERLEKKLRQRQKTIESLKLQSLSQDEDDVSEAARRRSIRLASMTHDDALTLRKAISSRDLNEEPLDENEEKPKKKKKKQRSKSQQPKASGEEEETGENMDGTKLFITNETLDNNAEEPKKKKKKKKKKKEEVEEGNAEEIADSVV